MSTILRLIRERPLLLAYVLLVLIIIGGAASAQRVTTSGHHADCLIQQRVWDFGHEISINLTEHDELAPSARNDPTLRAALQAQLEVMNARKDRERAKLLDLLARHPTC